MQKMWPINQFLMLVSTLTLLLVSMKYATDLLAPFFLSIALAIVLLPLLSYLQRKHIPKVVALFLIILLSFVPVLTLGGYIGTEANDFANNFHNMKEQFDESLSSFSQMLNTMGIGITKADMGSMLEKSNISGLIKNLASQVSVEFSNIFLIFFTVAFMLMEADFLHDKLKKILTNSKIDLEESMAIISKIKTYFIIKVKTSLLTALWILAVLWYYDISYFYMWATLAFFLNFIPVVGSIFAAIPAIIIAFIDHGGMTALWIALWYMIINTVVGNILEPRIMGKGLGLSALIIFLSMTLWGWVFGPTGMILSVPLTMVMQFFFAQYKETEWVALMLSDYENETSNNNKGEKDGKNDHA